MRTQTFFTSDWHLGHANVIKFDNRPFDNITQMGEALVRNFNKQVPTYGITYFLGDMVLGDFEQSSKFIRQLNGLKILVVGNHDRNYQSCYNSGFDLVMNSATIKVHNEIVTLSHCPLPGIHREDMTGFVGKGTFWHGDHKNHQFMVENKGQFHLHGHIHSPNGGRSQKILGRQFDVGVAANNFRPVHVSQIESWIMKTLKEENE